MSEPITIYTWVQGTGVRHTTPKVFFKSMNDQQNYDEYNSEENAKQIARLFAEALPGNTNDVFYKALADEIRRVLDLEKGAQLLKSPYDLENRMRAAVNELAGVEL